MDDSAAATDYTTNKSTIRHGYERVGRRTGLEARCSEHGSAQMTASTISSIIDHRSSRDLRYDRFGALSTVYERALRLDHLSQPDPLNRQDIHVYTAGYSLSLPPSRMITTSTVPWLIRACRHTAGRLVPVSTKGSIITPAKMYPQCAHSGTHCYSQLH